MKIAIEGCAHGELEKIYDTIAIIEKQENYKVDLLLCCGDFQSTRNLDDLHCMAIPKKFHDMCSFYKYYSGEKVAPILTIFIGGNHEASNYLQELPYGGWVAPNIYYLGYAGVVNVNGIRIGGISGIYKGYDYFKGHFEYSPYTDESKRTVYHIRQLEVYRLKQLSSKIDIMMSHDWPRGVYNFGNSDQLIRFKPHFRDEISKNTLGSPPCEDLLKHLKPDYWFSAHLHCKFTAVIPHEDTDQVTKFLALDKCLPRRRFLQILDLDGGQDGPIQISHDLEWLTILNLTKHLGNAKNTTEYMPGPGSPYRWNFTPTAEEKEAVFKKFNENTLVPLTFQRTVEPFNPDANSRYSNQPKAQINPQTTVLCDLLNIDDPLSIAMVMNGQELNHSSYTDSISSSSNLDDSIFSLDSNSSFNTTSELTPLKVKRTEFTLPAPLNKSKNPDELLLDDDADDSEDADYIIDSSSEVNSSILNSTVSTSFTPGSHSPQSESTDSNNKSLTEDVREMLTKSVNIVSPNNVRKSPDDTEDKNGVAVGSQQPKKFKRRNQAIYNAASDD